MWAEDEHRIGLHPVNRIVWVPIGEVPVANVNWKYQWLWLVGFVEPSSGQTKRVDPADTKLARI